jgi:hypothetical protein
MQEVDDDFADKRFEETRRKILFHLELALEACVQPREFHVLIGQIVRLQEDVLTVTPGVPADSWRAKSRLFPWRGVLSKADWLSWGMVSFVSGLGSVFLLEKIHEIIASWQKLGSLNIIGSAYAAAGGGGVDPTALLVFQLVIAAMVPLLGIGGFCALIFSNSPEGRKGGKELLIGVTGFVLGAATRMIA